LKHIGVSLQYTNGVVILSYISTSQLDVPHTRYRVINTTGDISAANFRNSLRAVACLLVQDPLLLSLKCWLTGNTFWNPAL